MAPFVVGSQTPEARDNTSALEQRIGAATSVIMPLLEFGAIGFVTWVLCYFICFQYLIDPSEDLRQSFNVQPRRSTGIALIVVYAILLLMLLIPWMRLLQVIWTKQDMHLGPSRRRRRKLLTRRQWSNTMRTYQTTKAFLCFARSAAFSSLIGHITARNWVAV
jgi:hypothetical protein